MAPRSVRLAFALLIGPQLTRCVADGDTLDSTAEPIVVCARGETVEGVDVSIYQGSNIDWNAVHASGRQFGITRIGDGLGGDSTFAINWPGIRAAGMIRGAYQFYRPNRDANAQADIVCAAVGRLGPGDLPVMLDLEADNGVSPAGIRASIDTWIARVRECTGKVPLIYTAGWFWNPHVASPDYGSYPLAVAAYGPRCPDLPLGWGDWTLYQYSDGDVRYTPGVGAVPGIGQSVDRDRFNGSLADLQRFVQSNQAPVGYLDHTGCDALAGWSMDPDAPANVIDVHLYIGGPAGSGAPGFPVHAGIHRDDLCTAIGSCNHGFSFTPPYGLFDGADHPVFAYGIDAMGGANPLLGTGTLHCAAPTPSVPPERGVRRHVPNPDVLAAWRWTSLDVAHLTDATLNAYPDGPDVVAAPTLTVTLHNRGSATWNPNEVWLVPVAPRERDSALCEATSWRSCREAATVAAPVAPGADVTLTVPLRAPATVGTIRECFALRSGAVYFSDPGQMGFADDALCRTFAVTAPVTTRDAGAADVGTADVETADVGNDDAGDPLSDGAVDPAPDSSALTGSCGCRAPGSRPSSHGALALVGLALAARRRRRWL